MTRRMTVIGIFGAGVVVGIATLIYLAGTGGRESPLTNAQQGTKPVPDPKGGTVFLSEGLTQRKLDGGKSAYHLIIVRRVYRSGEVTYYIHVGTNQYITDLSLNDATDLAALAKFVKDKKKSAAKEVTAAWVHIYYKDIGGGNAPPFNYNVATGDWTFGTTEHLLPGDFATVLTEQVQEVQRLKGVPPSFKF